MNLMIRETYPDIIGPSLVSLTTVCPRRCNAFSIDGQLTPFHPISRDTAHRFSYGDLRQVAITIGNDELRNLLSHVFSELHSLL